MSDEVHGGELEGSGRAARGRPRKTLRPELDPERRAFADLMRAEFFDRMKALGWDYARISRHLGRGFSGTTLSRIASGETVPDRQKLNLILSLVEEIAEQPLTEHVRGHVYEVYMRALAVAKPEWHRAYLVQDENRRLLAEVERYGRRGGEGSADSGPSQEPLDLEHPVVHLRDEVLQHVQQTVQAQIPLITQPSLRQVPASELSPGDAMLLEIRQALGLVGESVTRHITLLEAAEDVSAPETTPVSAVPAVEPADPTPNSGPGKQPPQSTARTAVLIAVTAVLVVVVLLLGVLLDRALRPDTVSAEPSAGPTGPAAPGTTESGEGGKSGSPKGTRTKEGATGPGPSRRRADSGPGDGASAGAVDGGTSQDSGGTFDRGTSRDSGGTSDRETDQDEGASGRGTDQDNGGSVSPGATAGTGSSSPRANWTLTVRLSADSDGEIQVAHNDGQQAACRKTINEPAKECTYVIPHNNTVSLHAVDFVQSWGSGECQGADGHGDCAFFMVSDTEFDLHVLREAG